MRTIIFPTCTQQACLKHSDSVRRRRNSSRYIQRGTCQGIPTQSRASLRQFLQIPQLSNESAPQSEQTLIKCWQADKSTIKLPRYKYNTAVGASLHGLSLGYWIASCARASPATAAKWWSQTQTITSGVGATPTDALLRLVKKASRLMVGALVVSFGHPGSDEQNVALFESDALLAGGLFKV